MEVWELEARESIRDLVARYNANGDSGRFGPMLELFTPDALLEAPDRILQGRGAIRAFFEGVARGEGGRKRIRALRHHTATLQIDLVDRDEARGRCYFQVLTEEGLDHWGRYVDVYRRVEGRWLIAERRISVDGAVPGAWGGSASPAG